MAIVAEDYSESDNSREFQLCKVDPYVKMGILPPKANLRLLKFTLLAVSVLSPKW